MVGPGPLLLRQRGDFGKLTVFQCECMHVGADVCLYMYISVSVYTYMFAQCSRMMFMYVSDTHDSVGSVLTTRASEHLPGGGERSPPLGLPLGRHRPARHRYAVRIRQILLVSSFLLVSG